MKIAIGNDHAGVDVKRKIENYLFEKGHTVINKGSDAKESVDYPDYIHPVSLEVKEKKAQILNLRIGESQDKDTGVVPYQYCIGKMEK